MAKKALKKTHKVATKKKVAKTAVKTAIPKNRREDIPGIAPQLADLSNWKEAAIKLKISPFYKGVGSKPFSCLRATQVLMDQPPKNSKSKSVNDFFLAAECRD
jgi:hypothetical protein